MIMQLATLTVVTVVTAMIVPAVFHPCSPTSSNIKLYSKSSNNGPSEKQTASVQWMAHLSPIDFTIELIHFEGSKKRTPLNSEQRTLISPRHTLANIKLPLKMDSEVTPT